VLLGVGVTTVREDGEANLEPGDMVRCAFFDMILHSRMLLDPTHSFFGVNYLLTVATINCVETRKALIQDAVAVYIQIKIKAI
jgi:hypothetical protein